MSPDSAGQEHRAVFDDSEMTAGTAGGRAVPAVKWLWSAAVPSVEHAVLDQDGLVQLPQSAAR